MANGRQAVAAFSLLMAAGAHAETKPRERIAVLEIRNMLPVSERMEVHAQVFGDQIRAGILDLAPALDVMTRENISSLLEASGKKLEDCEGECEVETGRRLGADYVISGEVYRIGNSMRLGMRLHSTNSGTLLAAAQAEGADIDHLDRAVVESCAKLLSRFKSQNARPRLTTAEQLKFWTSREEHLSLALLAANGSFACDHELTATTYCTMTGPDLGASRLQGTARSGSGGLQSFASDLAVTEASSEYRLDKRGYGLTGAGVFFAAIGGAALVAESNQIVNGANQGAIRVFVGGMALAAVGLIATGVDLALGHEWTVEPAHLPADMGSEATAGLPGVCAAPAKAMSLPAGTTVRMFPGEEAGIISSTVSAMRVCAEPEEDAVPYRRVRLADGMSGYVKSSAFGDSP